MPLTPGTRFGPFEIVGVLGAGGMGEVYRASDPALGRQVAIKILPDVFLRDADRVARFEREARVLASLSHPHIGAIFGLERADHARGLVLELIEGPTLAERIAGRPLPLAETLGFARQIADALDAAHEKGIVHRDLKPANIKIAAKGVVKILDFGLAKSTDQDGPESSSSPTVAGATQPGAVLGTAAYMSPEQARGLPVDKRTDIWAFGCVLYEMLSGHAVFARSTASDTAVAILERQPDWNALPAATPPAVRRLLQRCLEKDARERLRDIGDARLELDHELSELRSARGSSTTSTTEPSPNARTRRPGLAAVVATVVLLLLAIGVFVTMSQPATPTPAPVTEPPLQLTDFNDSALHPALSPDGRLLTFIRGGRFGDSAPRGQVYVKILPKGEAVQLTHDSFTKEQPVFTPDGSRIIYTSVTNKFRWDSWQVPVLGGVPQLFLANASGLAWLDERRMLFAEIMSGVHMGIVTAAERGPSQGIYFPPGEGGMAHRAARSPDGKSLLVVEMDGSGWLPCRLMPFDGSSTGRQVGPLDGQCTTVAWSPDGRWMYFSSSSGGGFHIWRQRFPDGSPEQITTGPTEQEGTTLTADGAHLITSMGLQRAGIWLSEGEGERQLTSEGFAMLPSYGSSGQRVFYLLRGGSRGYATGELWSVHLKTGERQQMLPGFVMANYSISADEKRVVFTTSGNDSGDGVWIADLDRRTPPRQLTRDGAFRAFFGAPGEIIYMNQGSVRHLFRIKDDVAEPEMIVPDEVNNLVTVSRDGRWAVALIPRPESGGGTVMRFVSLRGERSMDVCNDECAIGFGPSRIGAPMFNWSTDGSSLYVGLQHFGLRTAATVVLPYRSGVPLATLYPKGLNTEDDVAANPGARVINEGNAFPAAGSEHLAWKPTTQSNLYQIRLPQ